MKIRKSNSSELFHETNTKRSGLQTTDKKNRLEQQLLEQQFLKIYLRIRPIKIPQNIYTTNPD